MTTEEIKIRFAEIGDAAMLARIGAKSFYDAFAGDARNRPEDMRAYMDENFTPDALERDLTEPNVIYLIAEAKGSAAGYAKLQIDSIEECVSAEKPVELCRLYALDEFIGKGVGKALMNACVELAYEKECDVFWLGVWEFNFRAQNFYAKFGFEKCGEHIFQLGTDAQTDWILQKIL